MHLENQRLVANEIVFIVRAYTLSLPWFVEFL